MNDYMTAISEPVLKNEGCIIKFIGDASLHVHGAPLDDNQHHYNAVRTGLAMLDAAEEFNKELEAKGKPRVGMGVGVNAGQTLIGNIGSKTRFGYDVLGDSVSTAARLEGQTKPYGVKIIISESVAKEVSDYYLTLELDIVAVKGKSIGTRIYTVLPITDANGGLDYLLAEKQHNIMLDLYRSQRWIEASIMCHKLIGEFDGSMDAYYEMLIHRIGEYQQDNKFPKDWDGTYISKTK
jgi:adenylate cyclase